MGHEEHKEHNALCSSWFLVNVVAYLLNSDQNVQECDATEAK
jgi:hypothetical protein